MSLDLSTKKVAHLYNSIGSLTYEKGHDEDGWIEVVSINAYDGPEQLYMFFKDLALHFKAMIKEEDDF